MREIKFRAWNKKHKEMLTNLELCFLNPLNANKTEYGIVYNPKLEGKLVQEFGDITQLTLMQYTGLKDKNGKEIFEGDIIRYFGYSQHQNHNGLVEFYKGCFMVDSTSLGHLALSGDEVAITYTCEIVGNIYENPKLLEVK